MLSLFLHGKYKVKKKLLKSVLWEKILKILNEITRLTMLITKNIQIEYSLAIASFMSHILNIKIKLLRIKIYYNTLFIT